MTSTSPPPSWWTSPGAARGRASRPTRRRSTWRGGAQHIRDYAERRTAVAAYAEGIRRTKELPEGEGLPCETITGGGTGTCAWEAESGLFTEIQPGSYVFMDADYAANRDEAGGPWRGFEQSLFILATVVTCWAGEFAVIDAGIKAANIDRAMPVPCDQAGIAYVGAADEHGKLALSTDAAPLRLGQKLRLIPGHCGPTVNLYDWIVGVRNGMVEAVWPVSARGAAP